MFRALVAGLFVLFATNLLASPLPVVDLTNTYIDIDVDDSLYSIPFQSGQTPTINGFFCRKNKLLHNSPCALITSDIIPQYTFKFYYPDTTTEVTSTVSVVKLSDRHTFSFNAPSLATNTKPIFTAVITKKTSGALVAKRTYPFLVKNGFSQSNYWSNSTNDMNVNVTVSPGQGIQNIFPYAVVNMNALNTSLDPVGKIWSYQLLVNGNIQSSGGFTGSSSPSIRLLLNDGIYNDVEIIISSEPNISGPAGNPVPPSEAFRKSYKLWSYLDSQPPVWASSPQTIYTKDNNLSFSQTVEDEFGFVKKAVSADLYLKNGTYIKSFPTTSVLSGDIYLSNSGSQLGAVKITATSNNMIFPEGDFYLKYRATDFGGNNSLLTHDITIDRTAPIIILAIEPSETTSTSHLVVPFSVTDPSNVKVYINGTVVKNDNVVSGTYSGQIDFNLDLGLNSFKIVSIDRAGNSSEIFRQITLIDVTPPEINVANVPETTPQSHLLFPYSVSDFSNLKVYFNGVLKKNVDSTSNTYSDQIDFQLAPGINSILIVAVDTAGNTSQADIKTTFIDTTSPIIEFISLPEATNSTNISASIEITETNPVETVVQFNEVQLDQFSGLSKTIPLTLVSGVNNLIITSTDISGNITTVQKAIYLDTAAPTLKVALESPYKTSEQTLNIPIFSSDMTKKTFRIYINDVLINTIILSEGVTSSSFSVNLVDGLNIIKVSVTDEAGNVSEQTHEVTFDGSAPLIRIVNLPSVSGQSSVSASIVSSGSGVLENKIFLNDSIVDTFSESNKVITLNLANGENLVRVESKDTNERTSVVTTIVTLDTYPPMVSFPSPSLNLTNDESYTLPLTVADLTLINLKIYMNGLLQKEFTSSNGNFSEEIEVDLVEGVNLIAVMATDEAGNVTTINYPLLTLDTIAPEISSINLHNGDIVGTEEFSLNVGTNEVLQGARVNDQELDLVENSSAFTYSIQHSVSGDQQLNIDLVDKAGNSVSYSFSYVFQLRLLNPNLISISDIGEDQVLISGSQGAAHPGSEITADAGFFNSAETVAQEDGSFALPMSNFRYVKLTSTDTNNNRSESFTLTHFADTTFAGVVKDSDGTPLPGVKVTIISTGQHVETDVMGAFAITNPALGDQLVTFDGRTVPQSVTSGLKSYSVTSINVNLGNSQKNILDRPIFLSPQMLDGTETSVAANSDTVVSSSHAPGVEIHIPANTVVFPGGESSGTINILEIPATNTTVELPEAATPNTVYALEPSGISFNERVKLVLPNQNDFPAGTEMIILSKNSETGNWEIDGSAIVTENNTIETKPNQGITHFSDVYAAPLGMEIKSFQDGDKPKFDNIGGAVKSEIPLPSFKSLGADFTPKLIYNSTWANPNIIISNIFDLPRKYFEASDSISAGGTFGSVKASATIQTWITPEYIDAQFTSNNVTSPKVRFSGMPDKSLVSYQADLSELPSGVYPGKSSYEIRFKELTIATQKIKSRDLSGKTKTKTKTWQQEKLLEQIFPQELLTSIYHQNHKTSEIGSGWKLNLTKKIINPQQDRILVENEDGSLSPYTFRNRLELVTDYQPNGIRSFVLDGNDVVFVNNLGQVFRKTSDGMTQVTTLPTYQGKVGVNTSWYSHSTRYCTKSGIWGCKKYHYDYYFNCNKYQVSYSNQRQIKSMLRSENGIIYLDQKGIIFGNNPNTPIAGVLKTPSPMIVADHSSSEQSFQSFCSNHAGGECSPDKINLASSRIKINSQTNEVGFCNQPRICNSGNCTTEWTIGSGIAPEEGYLDGELSSTKFNNPLSMVPGYIPNTFLVADYGNNLVRMVDLSSGQTTTFAGNQKTLDSGDGGFALQASMYHPRGIAVLDDSSVLVSTENGYIRKISTDGRISTFIGKPTSQGGILSDLTSMKDVALSSPSGMAFDSTNNFLYIADTGHNRILRVDLTREEARVVAGNGLCSSEGLVLGNALESPICRPEQIALSNDGTLFILNEADKGIVKLKFTNTLYAEYDSIKKDNSVLKRNSDSYTISTREGRVYTFNLKGLHVQTSDTVTGQVTTFEYDGTDKLRNVIFPTGKEIQITYSGGKLATLTDPAGRMTSFNFDGENLETVSYSDGTERSFVYDSQSILVQELNQRGMITQYVVDNWSRLKKIIKPNNSVFEFSDAVSKTISPDPSTPTELKSLSDGINQLKDTIKDGNGNETSFVKDISGYVHSIVDSSGGVTHITRDVEGRPLRVTKPNTSYVEYTYNPFGEVESKYDSETDSRERFSYNGYGSILFYTDPLNRNKSYEYTDRGLLKKAIDPNGNFVAYTYNELGLISSSTNGLGLTTTYTYNDDGNLASVKLPMGEITFFERDLAGNIISKTDAKNQVTHYTFDTFNRLKTYRTPSNNITLYNYLPSGELLSITNPLSFVTSFEYDDLGQVIKKTSPKGQITQLFYDNNGNVIKEITPKGDVKLMTYDENNRLKTRILPDDVYEYDYDSKGNLVGVSNNNSNFDITYITILDRDYIKTINSNVSDIPQNSSVYDYNAVGKKISSISNYHHFSYGFDDGYRQTSVSSSIGQSFGFGFDAVNRLTSISRPNSVNSTIVYDNNSFPTQISHGNGLEYYSYTRDPLGNKISIATQESISNLTYDTENQITSYSHPEAATINQLETFVYDSNGNITNDNQGSFLYDDKKFQLQEDYRYIYAYDLNGNLISKQEKGLGSKVWNFIYNSDDQLTSIDFYVSSTKVKNVSYFYDAFSRRVKKIVSDLQSNTVSERKYVYDEANIVAELDENDGVLAKYIHSSLTTDDPLSVEVTDLGVTKGISPSSGMYYFLKDTLGSIVGITNSSGVKVQRHIYSAFGKMTKIEDSDGNDITSSPIIRSHFTFTGREYDEESGLLYYRARYYDSSIGRFLQEDPLAGKIFEPNSINSRYAYVLNNPLKYTDSSGKNPILVAVGIGALIGGIIGGIDAIINHKDFTSSVIRGALVGAVIGGLAVTGNGWASGGIIVKSLIQASFTRKGSFLSNFDDYAYDNTVPTSVGTGGTVVAKGGFGLSEEIGSILTFVGVYLTLKDLNKTACDKENATDFARDNVCVK